MRSPGGLGLGALAILVALLALPALPTSALAAPRGVVVHTLLISGSNSSTVPIDHIVIVMMENHVYDNYFATYCLAAGAYCSTNATGIPPGTCVPYYPSDPDAGCVKPFLYTTNNVTTPTDMTHDWVSAHTAYDNGSLDGFYTAEAKKLSTFGYYDGSLLPTYWDLAEQYGLGDNFFASVLSYSTPNHWFLLAGQAPQAGINQSLLRSVPYRLTPSDKSYLDEANSTRSIADVLVNSSVTWKYYDWSLANTTYAQAIKGSATAGADGSALDYWNPLAAKSESYAPEMASHFVSNRQFFSDVSNGELPNVSWVIPNFNQSDHAPSMLTNGESYIASIVNTLSHSSAWNRTAIFVSWDDYGGYYDHVPPPAVDANGVSFRVPLLVIGPYVRENYVDHHFEYFESILHLIEWRFHLPSVTARDAAAPLPLEYFDFTASPRAPMTIPGPATAIYPATFQTLPAPPTPQNLTSTSGAGSVTLNWTIPAGRTAVGTYLLTYGPASAPSSSSLRADGSVHTLTISNLGGGVSYQFRLTSLTGNLTSGAAATAATPASSPYYSAPPNNASAVWELLPNAGPNAPGQRQAAGFVSDLADGVDVLFGGVAANGSYLSDTWEWTGGRWILLSAAGPAGRAFAGMVYDTTDRVVLLYGGTNTQGPRADTWKFLAGNWTNLSTSAGSPPKRSSPALVSDQGEGYVLMFGGRGSLGLLNDSWRFVNGKWTEGTMKSAPSPRSGASVAYDVLDKEVVLFGGAAASGAPLNDSWVFGHGAWKLLPASHAPSSRYGASMVYDGRDQYVLLIGGFGPSGYADASWQFSSGVWHPVSSSTSPPVRENGSIAYDSLHQAVMFGFGSGSTGALGDLWAYVPTLYATASGSPTFAIAPSVVSFTPFVFGGFVPYSYHWDFGDGSTPSTLQFASHTFLVPGSYWVAMRATDAAGITALVDVPVQIDGPLQADLRADLPNVDGTANFTATVVGGWAPYEADWSFGDGGTEAGLSVNHRFTTPGTQVVSAVITDAIGDSVTGTTTVTILQAGLAVSIVANVSSGPAPLSVAFNATARYGAAPYTLQWNFGDGSHWTKGSGASHVYTASGNYSAAVRVKDSTGATVSATWPISVTAPIQVAVAAAVPVGPGADRFAAELSGGRAPFTILWQFGDGARSTEPSPMHAFSSPGVYDVSLTVIDSTGASAVRDAVIAVAPSAPPSVGPLDALATPTVGPLVTPTPSPAAPSQSSPVQAARWVRVDGADPRSLVHSKVNGPSRNALPT